MNDLEIEASKLSAIEAIGAAGQVTAAGGDPAAFYRAWLKTHPDDPIGYAIAFNLGVILKDTGQDAEAEKYYRLAISVNPRCWDAQFNLGSQLERLGRKEEALNQWRSMLATSQGAIAQDRKLHLLTLNNLGRLLEACVRATLPVTVPGKEHSTK